MRHSEHFVQETGLRRPRTLIPRVPDPMCLTFKVQLSQGTVTSTMNSLGVFCVLQFGVNADPARPLHDPACFFYRVPSRWYIYTLIYHP